MTTNEFYNDDDSRSRARTDAPLPPLPPSVFDRSTEYEPSIQPHTPVTSPFDDPSYRPYGRESQQSIQSNYQYYGGGRDYDTNPFSDDIPLKTNTQKSPTDLYASDQFRYEPERTNTLAAEETRSNRKPKKKGFFSGKTPWVTYLLTLIQSIVFLVELIKNGVLTKTPIQIRPQFNPMVGPSPYVLINMGARYVPCMRAMPEIQKLDNLNWPCPNTTSSDYSCSLSQLCGFGDNHLPTEHPDQWFRFIIPIFLHAGFVHIGFNMLIQLTLGREMEKDVGPLRYLLVYLSSGIFGFVLGGNFAPSGISSTGASGALFGVIALVLLDLIYHWGDHRSPWVDFAWIIATVAISFALGLLPGLDNFSHIGGFLMGLVLGICLLHSPDSLRQRTGLDEPPYSAVAGGRKSRVEGTAVRQGFLKQPLRFFKGRKLLWWVWWLIRAAALVGVLISFILLVTNFYKENPTKCGWCKHLSCIDVHNWCNLGNLSVTNQTSTPAKRDLFFGPSSAELPFYF